MMAVSIYPDLDVGGGLCQYCLKYVNVHPGAHSVSTLDRDGTWLRRYYHVPCRKRHERETWHLQYDAMTLGEALDWLREGGCACACMGPPNGAPRGAGCHCALVTDQAKRLVAAAGYAAALMAVRGSNP